MKPDYISVLLNASAGRTQHGNSRFGSTFKTARRIARLFEIHGEKCELKLVPGSRMREEVAKLRDAGVSPVVVAGGDGTVSAAAAALVGTDIPLAILPVGTFNHFSKDMGLGSSLSRAVRVALHGKPVAVDTAEVNGIVFVNNSSLGIYPKWVRRRRTQGEVLGRGRWRTFLKSLRLVLRRFPSFSVLIRTSSEMIMLRTSFVFVANNQYRTDLLSLGRRSRLDTHRLYLLFAKTSGRMAFVRLMFRALIGRLRKSSEVDSLSADELWVLTGRRRMHVALDGEVYYLKQPLHYRIRPASLRVLRDRQRGTP